MKRRMVAESGDYGELSTGECKLAFAKTCFVEESRPGVFRHAELSGRAPPMEIGLVATDVETAYSHAVTVGAQAVKPPERKPSGQVVGYVRDNNGFLVETCSPRA